MKEEIIKSKFTAIKRNKLSTPIQKILKNKLINKGDMILDFGCGRGEDINFLKNKEYKIYGYDPNWHPNEESLNKKYDVILCTYVFCVLPAIIRDEILDKIKDSLKSNGKAYISVRRDIKSITKTKKGTTQYPVYLNLPVAFENSSFCIYELRK